VPTIAEEMKRSAIGYADHATARIVGLDKELAEIEKQKAKIEAEREKARGALKRAANFPVTNGIDYLCPLCWVDFHPPPNSQFRAAGYFSLQFLSF